LHRVADAMLDKNSGLMVGYEKLAKEFMCGALTV
jgi:hypothetical protein